MAKRVLGFRAESKLIHWAVVEGSQEEPEIVAKDKAAAPANADEASALGFYRERARHLFEQYKPDGVAVRSPEPTAQGSNKDGARRRLRIEGVLLEASHSWSLNVTIGPLATISSKLKTKRAKEYLSLGKLRGLDLTKAPAKIREAVLVAVALLPRASDDDREQES